MKKILLIILIVGSSLINAGLCYNPETQQMEDCGEDEETLML